MCSPPWRLFVFFCPKTHNNYSVHFYKLNIQTSVKTHSPPAAQVVHDLESRVHALTVQLDAKQAQILTLQEEFSRSTVNNTAAQQQIQSLQHQKEADAAVIHSLKKEALAHQSTYQELFTSSEKLKQHVVLLNGMPRCFVNRKRESKKKKKSNTFDRLWS